MASRCNYAPTTGHHSAVTSSRTLSRLMGRQTRTLLPVPASHLQPRIVPPKEVRQRLQNIRQKQRSFYNRGTQSLQELPVGSPVTVYNMPTRTWSPAKVVQTANTPRAYIVETEEGQQLQRTREHLRPAPPPPPPRATIDPPERSERPESQLRRSDRARQPPKRYPMPEF
ncbi:unnamed protein product [Ixodes hexagonus]